MGLAEQIVWRPRKVR